MAGTMWAMEASCPHSFGAVSVRVGGGGGLLRDVASEMPRVLIYGICELKMINY